MSSTNGRFWILCGAVCGGLAVALGAFGAHGLGDVLLRKYEGQTKQVMGATVPAAEKYLEDFKTAADYQMTHALALIALGLLPFGWPQRSVKVAGWSFLMGILLFSGSLYVLVLTGYTKLGMITPVGGTLMIVGWGALATAALTRSPKS